MNDEALELKRAFVRMSIAMTMHIGSSFMQEYDGLPDGILVTPEPARAIFDEIFNDEPSKLAYLWLWTDKGQDFYRAEVSKHLGHDDELTFEDSLDALKHYEGARGVVGRVISGLFQAQDIAYDEDNSGAQQAFAILALLANEWEVSLPLLLVNRNKSELVDKLFNLTISDPKNISRIVTEAFNEQTLESLLSGTPLSL